MSSVKNWWIDNLYRIVFLAILACIFLASNASAEIKKADSTLYDKQLRGVMMVAVEEFDIPFLMPEKTVFLFINLGGAYLDVYAVATKPFPSYKLVPGYKLASLLEGACRSTILESSRFEWYEMRRLLIARAHFAKSRLGTTSSETTAPVGKIISAIKSSGYEVYAVLKTPKTAAVEAEGKLPRTSGRKYYYYDVSKASPSYTVSASAKIPISTAVLVFLVHFHLALACLLTISAAVALGRSKRIPIEKKRRLFIKVANYPLIAAVAIGLPCYIFYLRSSVFVTVMDIWFGGPPSAARTMRLSAGEPIMLVVFIVVVTILAKKLFGPDMNSPSLPDVTKEERASDFRVRLFLYSPMILGVLLVILKPVLPSQNPLQPYMFSISLFLIFLAPTLLVKLFGKRLGKTTKEDDLTRRTNDLAAQMGARYREVSISEGAFGKRYAFAAAGVGGSIGVTRRLMEVMTPDELDFILAHELAHLKHKHVLKQVIYTITIIAFVQSPLLFRFLDMDYLSHLLIALVLLVLPLVAVIMFIGMFSWVSKKRERIADRLALETTRNLEAAESALLKCARYSTMPYAHDMTDFSTHPKMSKRLAMLRKAAKEANLEADNEADQKVSHEG